MYGNGRLPISYSAGVGQNGSVPKCPTRPLQNHLIEVAAGVILRRENVAISTRRQAPMTCCGGHSSAGSPGRLGDLARRPRTRCDPPQAPYVPSDCLRAAWSWQCWSSPGLPTSEPDTGIMEGDGSQDVPILACDVEVAAWRQRPRAQRIRHHAAGTQNGLTYSRRKIK